MYDDTLRARVPVDQIQPLANYLQIILTRYLNPDGIRNEYTQGNGCATFKRGSCEACISTTKSDGVVDLELRLLSTNDDLDHPTEELPSLIRDILSEKGYLVQPELNPDQMPIFNKY
jgi:hypothetical protein